MFSDPRTLFGIVILAVFIMGFFHLFLLPVLIMIFGDKLPIDIVPVKQYVIILFSISLGVSVFHRNHTINISKANKKESERKELVCKASKKCQDDKAQFKSEFRDSVVVSTSGARFYKGSRCSSNCSGHIAGYKWAEKRGITKEYGCNAKSRSFTQGCLLYVDDFYLENEYQ